MTSIMQFCRFESTEQVLRAEELVSFIHSNKNDFDLEAELFLVSVEVSVK